jgi:hypothetical protein
MKIQELASAGKRRTLATWMSVERGAAKVGEYAKLERVLASLLAFTPLVLMIRDPGPTRESISAYYSMSENQLFYVPLTIAAMLFIVNGVLKGERNYNIILGVALAGLLLFNQDDWTPLHSVFAISFFAGNAAVVLLFSPATWRRFRIAFALLVGLVMVSYFLGWITFFQAEWLSLFAIAVHFVFASWKLWGYAIPKRRPIASIAE